MKSISQFLIRIYDTLNAAWLKHSNERRIGVVLIWIYAITLLAVELKRQGLYPDWLPEPPSSHYYSIQLAFTLILGMEVISLIFIIPSSLVKSMGKQMEILTLILLRNAFKELSILPEPVNITITEIDPIINIIVSATASLCVFTCLGFYHRIPQKQPSLPTPELTRQYIFSKKMLSLLLMLIFAGIGSYDLYLYFHGVYSEFFETIYTALIFADIAMVLIAQRYMPGYFAVFRNSGFVIGTLMMRLSISAEPILSAGLAVFAGVFILSLTWISSYFNPQEKH